MTNLPPKPPRPAPRTLWTEPEPVEESKPVSMETKPEPIPVSPIPGVTESKMFFEVFVFHPDASIPKAALIEVLQAAQLRFAPDLFRQLSPEAQRHFLRLDRTGTLHRVDASSRRRE